MKDDSGKEYGLAALMWGLWNLEDYDTLYTLCQHLGALAVKNKTHAHIEGVDNE